MKKIKRILIYLLISIISFSSTCMDVSAYSSQDSFSTRTLTGQYIKKLHSNGSGKFKSIGMITRNSDGHFVYCVQPWIDLGEGNTYSASESNQAEILGVSGDTWRRLMLIAYYGYGYGNHTDERWYGITQLMIWSTVDPSGNFFFTYTANGAHDYRYDWMKDEIENLIANHYTRPNFNVSSLTLNLGESITLYDSNNVLNNFEVRTSNNVSATKNGNSLTLTANSVGNTTISVVKNSTNGSGDNTGILYNYLDRQKTMSRGYVDPVVTDININVVGGKIKLIKQDSKNNSVVAQGEATLIGAKYGIYNSSNNLVEILTIGNDSTAITGYLKPGTYSIKELSPSKGYKLDNNVYHINLTSSTQEITVKEDVIENYISILKQYDFVDGKTTFLNAESGIVFNIYDHNDNFVKNITTDKNGYATTTLPYGVYRFSQQNSNTGFLKIHDFYITVDENSESEQYYNILNNKISAYLQVFKVDEETNNRIAIPNTKFRILNTDTNQYVSQYVGGKVYDTFSTDEEGKFVTYLKLEAGNYKLIEISSPKGYLINNDGLEFSIGDDTHYAYTTYGAFVTVTFKDKAIKGIIGINKIGEVFDISDNTFNYKNNKPLEGINYNIYASGDIKSADGNYIYYNDGDLVDTIVTDNDGNASSKELPLGKYKVIETKTADDYVLDIEEYIVELTEKDNRTAIVYSNLNHFNYLKKGKIEFTKTDLVSGGVIPNTKIEIYTEEDELIYTGITDEDGKITINNLPVNKKMYIVETEASTGYVLSDEKIYFEIKEDGEIVKVNMTNKKITSKVKLHKTDEEENPLKGVQIGIYDLNDNLIYSYLTDESGNIELELDYGSYYFKEILSLNGYKLSEEKIYFNVTKDGEEIELSLINNLEEIEIPNTEKNEVPIYQALTTILFFIGVGVIFYDKNKLKK